MDFGASFEAGSPLFRRFILVVWAKKQGKTGPNAARKAPPILFGAGSSRSLKLHGGFRLIVQLREDTDGSYIFVEAIEDYHKG